MTKIILFLSVFITSSSFSQNVFIPDAAFKEYLVGNTDINTNGDDEIQVSEARDFSGDINCEEMNIYDLTGIEEFTALTSLNCESTLVTSIDVSKNTALTSLRCGGWERGSQLTSLDVSNNTNLTFLKCAGSQLSSLDVSNNTALTQLDCSQSQLTSIDVSNNTALTLLNCSQNLLTSLDVSKNKALTVLRCDGNQFNCVERGSYDWAE